MQSVAGSLVPQRGKLHIGEIDKRRTRVYNMHVHEKNTLKFAVLGAKISDAKLLVNGLLLSIIKPEYNNNWTTETVTDLPFFGDKGFHRGLTDVPVEIVLTTDEDDFPSVRLQLIEPSLTWDNAGNAGGELKENSYSEEVDVQTVNGVKKFHIVYMQNACGYARAN